MVTTSELIRIKHLCFFISCHGTHTELHLLTPSIPTRRSSDLEILRVEERALDAASAVLQRHERRRLAAFADAAHLAGDDHGGFRPPAAAFLLRAVVLRSEEHTSELQSLMRITYAVFCLKKKITNLKAR